MPETQQDIEARVLSPRRYRGPKDAESQPIGDMADDLIARLNAGETRVDILKAWACSGSTLGAWIRHETARLYVRREHLPAVLEFAETLRAKELESEGA